MPYKPRSGCLCWLCGYGARSRWLPVHFACLVWNCVTSMHSRLAAVVSKISANLQNPKFRTVAARYGNIAAMSSDTGAGRQGEIRQNADRHISHRHDGARIRSSSEARRHPDLVSQQTHTVIYYLTIHSRVCFQLLIYEMTER